MTLATSVVFTTNFIQIEINEPRFPSNATPFFCHSLITFLQSVNKDCYPAISE